MWRANVSFLPIRYVSRAHPKDERRHVILSTASMRPNDFASQLNMSLPNGWGIIRTITDLCMKQPEGKYVLVKDPNKVSLSCSLRNRLFIQRMHLVSINFLPSKRDLSRLRSTIFLFTASFLSMSNVVDAMISHSLSFVFTRCQ